MTAVEIHETAGGCSVEHGGTWRRYCAALGAMIVAALVGLAGIQLVVDPLGVFGTGLERLSPWRSLHFRGAKGEALAQGGYDAIILGTSRSMAGFDPQHEAWEGRTVYDASLDGTNLWELERQWRVAAAANNPDRLLVETSLLGFGSARTGSADFADSRLPTGAVRLDTRMSWLFGSRVLALAVGVVRGAAANTLPRRSVRPDGHREYRESPQSNRELFEGLLEQNFLVSPETYNGFEFSTERVEALERIVRSARAEGARVDLVIPPVHAVQFEVLERMGLGDDLIRLRRELVELVARVNADQPSGPEVRAWDFMGWTGAQAEPVAGSGEPAMVGYYESSHFTARLGGQVLRRIYTSPDCDVTCRAFGVDLAQVDLEIRAERLATERADWRHENPDTVVWIDAMEARTAAERSRRLREARAARVGHDGGSAGSPGGPL